jgi:predicted esterase YcpF (UPF0227 family)
MIEIYMTIIFVLMIIDSIWMSILQKRNKKICDTFDELIIKFIEHNQLMYNKTNDHIKSLRTISESISNQIKDYQVIRRTADDMKAINRESLQQQQAVKQIVKDMRNQKISFTEVNKAIQIIKSKTEVKK